MPSSADLSPGFLVVHGNRAESLRDLLLAWMARHPLGPLEPEPVLVQSQGVAQWFKLAQARPVGQGGHGVSAAVQVQLPSQFIWQAYRAVLGESEVPAHSPLDEAPLVWRLMRLLPELLAQPVFAPLARFLNDDADGRKRHQLAQRLADLFDQYQVYRADWLARWAEGDDRIQPARGPAQDLPSDLLWQPALWRALRADVGQAGAEASRAAVHQRFMARVQAWPDTQPRPPGLPRRVSVFGISSLPRQALQVLAALGRWSQVLLAVLNPCEHDWSHLMADQDLLRAERHRQARRPGSPAQVPEDQLHLHGHPLLAAWGKQGRDFIRLLDEHDEHQRQAARLAELGLRVDSFEPPPTQHLLGQLQDDIRDLRPLAETRSRWPAVDPQQDHSVRFHVAHSPQREVEVLHDELLHALAADPSLQPRDIIVMVPDVATYAPHVQAVFGATTADDLRHLPYSLADRSPRHQDPLLVALERLLHLPESRLGVSELLDGLSLPATQRRLGLQPGDLPVLQRWIRAAEVRWGLHAEQRAHLGLPAQDWAHTWEAGLQRLLLGQAMGHPVGVAAPGRTEPPGGSAWAGIEPVDEVGGLEARLLGTLVQWLGRLNHHWQQLREPATPVVWGERLRLLLADAFQADDGRDGFTLLRLHSHLQSWLDTCQAAGLDQPLPLAVVREHWLSQLEAGGQGQPFLGGSVTIATLMPMRAIPFRVVALLGMNDGDYPRSREPLDFDLMGRDWRPGDRSRREDDRYLFLEALLSARDQLLVSWVGRSIHDDSERAPSVLVAQLRDHLAAGWRLGGTTGATSAAAPAEPGRALLQALTRTHRLQPFHPDYFRAGVPDRQRSHATEWRAGWLAARQVAEPGNAGAVPAAPGPIRLPAPAGPTVLSLRELGDFLKLPARSFLRGRLGIHFDPPAGPSPDEEPFALDGLARWQLQDELVQAQLAALAAGMPRQDALVAQLAQFQRRGALAPGAFGRRMQAELAEPMDELFKDYQKACEEWPEPRPDVWLDLDGQGQAAAPDAPLRVRDSLTLLRGRPDAPGLARVVIDPSGLASKTGAWRRDKLLGHWVVHLAGQLVGQLAGPVPGQHSPGLTSVLVSKAGTVTLPPLDPAQAAGAWQQLLQAWVLGQTQPLPLAPRSSLAWLETLSARPGGPPASAAQLAEARAAARSVYEDHDPRFNRHAEGVASAELARVFPSFEALWSDGEFAHWAQALLQPLMEALPKPARRGKAGAPSASA